MMGKIKYFVFGLLIISFSSFSQVGINTVEPDFSAMLDIRSNNKGVLFPSLTIIERDAINTAAAAAGEIVPGGLTIYCTDCCVNGTGSLYYYNEVEWRPLDKDCRDINAVPACIAVTTALLAENHMSNPVSINAFFDGFETFVTQDVPGGFVQGNLRMHQDAGMGNADVVEFALGQVLPVGSQVVLYWSDGDNNAINLGVLVDLDNGGAMSQASIDTRNGVLPNSTNISNGADDFILTITLIADTDTITVRSFEDGVGDDPYLLEFVMLDKNGGVIPPTCN